MAPVPSRLHPPPRRSHGAEAEAGAGQASRGEGMAAVVVVDEGRADEGSRCFGGNVEVEGGGGGGGGGEREGTTNGRVSVVVASPGQSGKLQWQQQRQRTEKSSGGDGGGSSSGEDSGTAVAAPGDVSGSGGRRKGQRRRDCDVESADEDGRDPREASSYVWRILAYLTFINPFLCLFNLTYAAVIVLLSTFTFPVRYFLSPTTHFFYRAFSKSLSRLLLIHLRFIHPSSSQQQQQRQQQAVLPTTDDFSAHRAAAVHIGGVVLALALALPSAGLGLVWLYTEVLLGEKNDRNGVEYRSVMALKRCWEEYVLYALKMKSIDS